MNTIEVDRTDDLWKLYKTNLKAFRREYSEAVRAQFDRALFPLGYSQLRYDHSTNSSSVTYERKGGTQIIIRFLGEGFIHGSLYVPGSKYSIPVGLFQEKKGPHSIDDFVEALIEKEREISQ
jgi:hypothetical protein